jgi:PGF-pre-PGF domain-containing protein
MATITCADAGTYNALDEALTWGTSPCTLTGVENSTLTNGNVTFFGNAFTINFNPGSSIELNNTIQFNGSSTTITFAGTGVPKFTYNSTWSAATGFKNNTLIDVIGTGQTIQSSFNITLNTTANGFGGGNFAGTGINISASAKNNILSQFWKINGPGLIGAAINLSGTGNTVTMSSLNITQLTGTTAKLFLGTTATGNTINDIDWTTTNKPSVYIYNGTAINPSFTNATRSAWYFYNSSWSTSGSNMNVTINVSSLIPISGNVGIKANFTNVTWSNPYVATNPKNSSLAISNGYSGGFIFNRTEKTIFRNFPAMVPVNITFGDNYFGNSYQELNIGTVYILNFNPVNSTTPGVGLFNVTGTTNWSTIPDFTNAQNVTFVVDDGLTSHTLYGNLSFIDPLDLTDPNTGTGLAALGTNLAMSASGNSIELKGTANGMTALNKAAMLTVYPTNFAFTGGSTNINVQADGTSIYNQGTYSRGTYLSDSAVLTVGNGNITIPVLHFTKYDFGSGINPPAPAPAPGPGGDSAPASSAQQPVVQPVVPAASTTVAVNVGGNSAITSVAVTGTGISNLIVTALPQSAPPASITAPATTVYQYMEVIPARYTTISSVTFNFDVPTSWLAGKGYTKNDITLTLWDPVAKTWSNIPTAIISEKQGSITYQAIAPHMSEFAIVYQKDVSAQAQASVTVIQTSVVPLGTTTTVMTTNTPSVRSTTPTPTQTIAPAPVTPPTTGMPLTTMVMAVVGIIIIVAGAFLVRRWWIRRQNPALFKELD